MAEAQLLLSNETNVTETIQEQPVVRKLNTNYHIIAQMFTSVFLNELKPDYCRRMSDPYVTHAQ